MARSNSPEQIASLGSVFLLGLLFHTQLGLILFVIGLLINLVAWLWMRDGRNTHVEDSKRFA